MARMIVLICSFIALSAGTAQADLGPSGDFPDRPCNLANRMNVYINARGELYECVCEALAKGFACDWYMQGKVQSISARKVLKRKHIRIIVKLRAVPV